MNFRGILDSYGKITLDKYEGLKMSEASRIVIQKLRQRDLILDIPDVVKTSQYIHKKTKEKLILRTEPNLFTEVDEIDIEMFKKEIDPLVKNV